MNISCIKQNIKNKFKCVLSINITYSIMCQRILYSPFIDREFETSRSYRSAKNKTKYVKRVIDCYVTNLYNLIISLFLTDVLQ